MPSRLLLDLERYVTAKVVYDRSQLYDRLPQRHEFVQLDAVVHLDHEAGEAVAYRDVGEDEWWCRGHVPGRPLLPGVLMLEAGAQLAAFMEKYSDPSFPGFVGFGGVDDCKFRKTVTPPSRLWLLCRRVDARSRRTISDVQGVVDGVLVFEARVTGLIMPNPLSM
ncbi:MAG: beta-hydroxyacyl-ACP dehydratase [Planctomycetes bacterium]|nr:beta-hydroxyacyl-ACP dehydratase [Planctomycetota bacterium]